MQHIPWWGTVSVPENNSFLLNSATFILAVEHKAKEWCIHVKRKIGIVLIRNWCGDLVDAVNVVCRAFFYRADYT